MQVRAQDGSRYKPRAYKALFTALQRLLRWHQHDEIAKDATPAPVPELFRAPTIVKLQRAVDAGMKE